MIVVLGIERVEVEPKPNRLGGESGEVDLVVIEGCPRGIVGQMADGLPTRSAVGADHQPPGVCIEVGAGRAAQGYADTESFTRQKLIPLEDGRSRRGQVDRRRAESAEGASAGLVGARRLLTVPPGVRAARRPTSCAVPEAGCRPSVGAVFGVVEEQRIGGDGGRSAADLGEIVGLEHAEPGVVGLSGLNRIQGGRSAETTGRKDGPHRAGIRPADTLGLRRLDDRIAGVKHRWARWGQLESCRDDLLEVLPTEARAQVPKHRGPQFTVTVDLRDAQQPARAGDHFEEQRSKVAEAVGAVVIGDRSHAGGGVGKHILAEDRIAGERGRVGVAPALTHRAAMPQEQARRAIGVRR